MAMGFVVVERPAGQKTCRQSDHIHIHYKCMREGRTLAMGVVFHGRAAFYDDQMQFHCPLCSQVVNSIHFRARILGGFWARDPGPQSIEMGHKDALLAEPFSRASEAVVRACESQHQWQKAQYCHDVMTYYHDCVTLGSDSIANSLRGLLLAVSSEMRKNPVPILTFFLKGVYLSKSIKLLLRNSNAGAFPHCPDECLGCHPVRRFSSTQTSRKARYKDGAGMCQIG